MKTELLIEDDFDLTKIAESGQCFRWERVAPDTEGDDRETEELSYRIIAGTDCIYVTDLGEGRFQFEWDAFGSESEDGLPHRWYDYFDLATDYRSIRAKIDPAADPYLWNASEAGKGIRILRQDPWEMLVSFIISQNKNIPGIRRCIEALAGLCGERRTDCRGEEYYSFPTPEAISSLTEEALAGCRLGYRCRYVQAAAKAVLAGSNGNDGGSYGIDLAALRDASEAETIETLTGICGVGVKVANCVSLFGLHHVDAFPIDVWIRRILDAEYPEGFPFERYRPYCGIYQQYLFSYVRNKENAV